MTPLGGARLHAGKFYADTFVEFAGGHTTIAAFNPARQFLASLVQTAGDPVAAVTGTAEEILRRRWPAVQAQASSEAKAAAAGITATMGTVKFWPALVQAWVRGCVSKGRLEGVCELISGMVGSEKTPQTAGKPPAFKAAVADVLQASSDELWMAARASFPDA